MVFSPEALATAMTGGTFHYPRERSPHSRSAPTIEELNDRKCFCEYLYFYKLYISFTLSSTQCFYEELFLSKKYLELRYMFFWVFKQIFWNKIFKWCCMWCKVCTIRTHTYLYTRIIYCKILNKNVHIASIRTYILNTFGNVLHAGTQEAAGDIEIDQLRQRLVETEAAMERIVVQMGNIRSVKHKSSSQPETKVYEINFDAISQFQFISR